MVGGWWSNSVNTSFTMVAVAENVKLFASQSVTGGNARLLAYETTRSLEPPACISKGEE